MFRLFSTPAWFNGWDIVFETVILIVAILIAAYSWRLYKLNKENKFAYFSFAFILIAISFLFKIFTSSVLYYFPVRDVTATVLRPVAGSSLQYSALLYRSGFFVQMISMLGAWLLIFFVSQKSRERLKKLYEVSQILLFIYLVILISFVANFKFEVFYLTSSVILSLIVLNYYKNYLNTSNKNSYWIMLSFVFMLLGNLLIVFVFLTDSLYAVGEVLMLVGFLLLLGIYMRVTRR